MRPHAPLCALALTLASAAGAADAERYRFLPKQPRYLTANIDLRDASGSLWPNLVGGRNESGEVVLTQDGLSGAFTLRCDQHSQFDGEQSRRLLGDLVKSKPAIVLAISAVSSAGAKALSAEEELARATADAAERAAVPGRVTLVGSLALGERKVAINCQAGLKRIGERLYFSGSLTVPGADLGLAPATVQVDFGFSAYRHPDDLKAGADPNRGPAIELELPR